MKTTNTLIAVAATITLSILIGLLYWQDNQIKRLKDLINRQDTTVITKTDTVYNTIAFTDTLIKEKQTTIIKQDTIIKNTGDTLLPTLKKKYYQDTLIQNQDTLHYNLSIEGYTLNNNDSMPILRHFKASYKQKTITNNETVIIEKITPQKQNKWNVSIGVGTGYGIINKQPDIYLGLSIGYRIF